MVDETPVPEPNVAKNNTSLLEAVDAIRLLKEDHARLRKLLSELESTTERGVKKRRELLAELGPFIRAHAKIEEEIFYPAYKRAAETREDSIPYFEAHEEHALVDVVLPELEATSPSSEVFGAKAKVLKDLIEHHADEEEEEMLPKARRLLGKEKLGELGAEMAQRKEQLLNAPARKRAPRARK